ncbi:MAG: hypothetical protein MUC36_00760 [Planctomycetes bacterium]|jgi:hypothetical protein|nr:hypothetical protein [Planctomycetota bacterium]
MERIDSLLDELSSRHRNHDPRFLAAVRPMAASILDPALTDGQRVSLLELLAETFERDGQVRRDCVRAQAAWQQFFVAIHRLLRP